MLRINGRICPHLPSFFAKYKTLVPCFSKKKKTSTKVIFEQVHNKTCNKTCAASEGSDQPADQRNLIRIFADRMCRLQPPGYPKRDKREPLPHWVAVQAYLSLLWSHRSYCRIVGAGSIFRGDTATTVDTVTSGILLSVYLASQKHAYIILTPLNPTFI